MPFSHFLFVSDFTLLCFSKERVAVHQASLSFLFFSQDDCTHSYIIPLPSQTYTHFPSVLLYFTGLSASVCLGLDTVQKYKNRSAGIVASPRLHYFFSFLNVVHRLHVMLQIFGQGRLMCLREVT